MKKKIVLIVSLCMLVLGLAACGESQPEEVDYNGYSYDQLMEVSQGTATTLVQMSDEDMEAYLGQSGDEISTNLLKRWKEIKPLVGEFVELGEFDIEKTGKTLTTTQYLDFTKRDATMTCVYDYNSMQLEAISLDEIYTTGEKMQKAALNTLMGLGTVFLTLILISLVIYCFNIIPVLQKKAEEKKKAKEEAESPAQSSNYNNVPAREQEVEEVQPADDLELVAVITAAIAASEGAPTDGFVVRSIKRR